MMNQLEKNSNMPGPKMGKRPLDFDEANIKKSPTYEKWKALGDGETLRYACRTFTKGVTNEEERLMRRIMIARRNNKRDHEVLKKARLCVGETVGDYNTEMAAVASTATTTTTTTTTTATHTEKRKLGGTSDAKGLENVVSLHPYSDAIKNTINGRKVLTDEEIRQEMDVTAVESTRSYRAWSKLELGEDMYYNQKYIKGKEGHDWLLKKNIWRRMRYRRNNKKIVSQMMKQREKKEDSLADMPKLKMEQQPPALLMNPPIDDQTFKSEDCTTINEQSIPCPTLLPCEKTKEEISDAEAIVHLTHIETNLTTLSEQARALASEFAYNAETFIQKAASSYHAQQPLMTEDTAKVICNALENTNSLAPPNTQSNTSFTHAAKQISPEMHLLPVSLDQNTITQNVPLNIHQRDIFTANTDNSSQEEPLILPTQPSYESGDSCTVYLHLEKTMSSSSNNTNTEKSLSLNSNVAETQESINILNHNISKGEHKLGHNVEMKDHSIMVVTSTDSSKKPTPITIKLEEIDIETNKENPVNSLSHREITTNTIEKHLLLQNKELKDKGNEERSITENIMETSSQSKTQVPLADDLNCSIHRIVLSQLEPGTKEIEPISTKDGQANSHTSLEHGNLKEQLNFIDDKTIDNSVKLIISDNQKKKDAIDLELDKAKERDVSFTSNDRKQYNSLISNETTINQNLDTNLSEESKETKPSLQSVDINVRKPTELLYTAETKSSTEMLNSVETEKSTIQLSTATVKSPKESRFFNINSKENIKEKVPDLVSNFTSVNKSAFV